jgi:methyl-accepting chemotaxis protein
MHSQLPPVYYIIFTGITCFGVLMQAFVLLGMFIILRRVMAQMHAITEELRPHLALIVSTTRNIIEESAPTIKNVIQDSAPKIKTAVNNVTEVTHKVRTEADHVSATLDELLQKANAQANRVDEIVTAGIDSAAHATHAVQNVITAPVRQASALFAGLKAGFDVLRGRNHSAYPPADDSYGG